MAAVPDDSPHDISLAVFCQNEAARLGACIASIAVAAQGRRACVTVLVNGSSDGSAGVALAALQQTGLPGRVWRIRHADKSNAINRSFYELRRPAGLEVFLDGYSVIGADALGGLERALSGTPAAMAATGVAGNGRTMQAATAETMRRGGRLHGQLHAFRPAFLDRLTAAGLRLPVGLYRGDGLLGSMACHDLDPRVHPWDGHRIRGAAAATYSIAQLSPWRPADIARQFRRKVRQMRGRLENAAVKSIIATQGYQGLPRHADDMIAAWLAHNPVPPTALADRAFMALALRRHACAVRADEDALTPALVGRTD